jgi:hypothetical protein
MDDCQSEEAAAERADEIMASLGSALSDDGPGDPAVPRAALAELTELADCFAAVPWLAQGLLAFYRGIVHRELWERFELAADLDAACDLLLTAVETSLELDEPDEDVVAELLLSVRERLHLAPAARDRDIFITWTTWLLDRLPADQEQTDSPAEDIDPLWLREQLALLLHDRADDAADSDDGNGSRLADLNAAIAHYEALLPTRPVGQADRAELLAFLVHAYWDRMSLTGSQDESVDRLTRHAREAWTAPGLPEEGRAIVGMCLGTGLLEQFARPGWHIDPTSVDLGIGALRAVLPEMAEEPELCVVAETALGLLLVGRGQLAGDAASMREAEPYLLSAASVLQPDDPKWSIVTRMLAIAEAVLANAGFAGGHPELAIRLLRAAAEQPQDDPELPAMIDQALSAMLIARTAGRRGPDADEGIRLLGVAFEKAPPGSPTRLALAGNLASALAGQFFVKGDRQDLAAAQFYLDELDRTTSAGPPGALAEADPDGPVVVELARGQIALAYGIADRDPAAIRTGIDRLRAAIRLTGPGHPWFGRLRSDLGLSLLMYFDHTRTDVATLREGITELEAAITLLPPGHPMLDMTRFRAAAGLFMLGHTLLDPTAMREGAARLGRLRADWASSVGDPVRVIGMLAIMHAELHRVTGAAADLAAARDWYAKAAEEFDQQPGHPQHGSTLIGLARLERRVGGRQAAISAGLAALRARARDVLLQTGPAHGLVTARIAAAEAAEIAAWCLADDAPGQAIEALELGRGLVLHAATSTADLPELLDHAGRADLAGEWRALAGQQPAEPPWDAAAHPPTATVLLGPSLAVPSDLRARTLAALRDDTLVSPPGHQEIADALRRVGADALVYLVPPAAGAPGNALLVPAAGGDPRALPLPGLTAATRGPLDEFAAAQTSLLAEDAEDDDALPEWGGKLGPLCDWAWTAVLEPLLPQLPRTAPDGPPRLVLVPVGELGLVPWHAARRPADGAGWRYAIADAVFSYAASGRQLAGVSRRPALPLAVDPVIVAPPAKDLESGLAEASAVRGIYPNGRYLGCAAERPGEPPADGPATPESVLRVLPAEHGPGASMLHLVCHGIASAGGAEASHLLLEDDRTLTVKEILGQANGRPAGSPGGVVVLAACQTDLTAADHDEALTLSTAFLAAGAVTAIGSRWSIPDNASAVLLFMFHHYLTTGAGAPADALRAAQLWMLDPDRQHPPSMPPELRKLRVPRHVFGWGALTHQGQ